MSLVHSPAPRVSPWLGRHLNKGFQGWMASNAKRVMASVVVLATAVITLLSAMELVHWSGGQIALVSAETAAVGALLTAIIAHFWPGTKAEPVAVAATFTAFVTATIALGTGFAWWIISQAQESAILAVVSATIGLATALLARNEVTAEPQSDQVGRVGGRS